MMYNIHQKDTIFIGAIRSSRTEINHLLKAWAAISLAFALAIGGLSAKLPYLLLLSAITVGVGFLLHELAHKIAAQHYHCWAEFRADDKMLLLAVILAFGLGFVFAAPGAVMIIGHVSNRKNGIISLAGPVTNIVLASLFLLITFIVPNTISYYGFMINTWLALFNMIPFGNLDGAKILRWDKKAYGITVGICLAFLLLQQGIL